METQLKDIQNLPDDRGVDIQRVGVKNVEVPLTIQQKNDSDQTVSAIAQLSVSLNSDFKGTHMSRFMEVLTDWGQKNLLGVDIKGCLLDIINRLEAQSAYLKIDFKYFIQKLAPKSNYKCPMGYNCSFEGYLEGDDYKFILGVNVPVTTLCPCSKEISEFGAHNQRAVIKVRISYDPDKIVWIEDLIQMIEECGSSPVYPILKREDEKFVTEYAYKNPKFVEDVLRDVVLKLRAEKIVEWFEVDCEAFESIHNHSAWAYQEEYRR